MLWKKLDKETIERIKEEEQSRDGFAILFGLFLSYIYSYFDNGSEEYLLKVVSYFFVVFFPISYIFYTPIKKFLKTILNLFTLF